MPESIPTGKAKNLVEYLDHLVATGKAKNSAIRHIKTAFTKVLKTVDGNEWERVSVTQINVDEYMQQFKDLTDVNYTSASLATYEHRIRKVLSWYREYMKDPSWVPDMKSTRSTERDEHETQLQPRLSTLKNSSPPQSRLMSEETSKTLDNTPLVTYPYPLEDGRLIEITLPVPLLKSDAQRIGNFIESIAVDDMQNSQKLGGKNVG